MEPLRVQRRQHEGAGGEGVAHDVPRGQGRGDGGGRDEVGPHPQQQQQARGEQGEAEHAVLVALLRAHVGAEGGVDAPLREQGWGISDKQPVKER